MCLVSEINEPWQPKQHLSTNHLLTSSHDLIRNCYVNKDVIFLEIRIQYMQVVQTALYHTHKPMCVTKSKYSFLIYLCEFLQIF